MDMKKIGETFARLRKQNNYTQESLAEKLNISPQAVSKWETGIGLPEASVLVILAKLYNTPIDVLLRPDEPRDIVVEFIKRNYATQESKILNWIPRISRWNPPQGCDMWYSFPAMISSALISIEAQEQGRNEITYAELNERFRDLLHITGMGYGFLWNTVERHLIEELWHINDVSEMVGQVMGYYGRDYLWLTPDNSTINEMRQLLKWSISQGRPVVMEWAGGIPEFNIVTGYENDGETLIGYTYCEECAAKFNEQGMFVNPARWDELWGNTQIRMLVIGNKKEQSVTDRDTIEYALKVLDKNEADDEKFFLTHEFIAGDMALHAWLEACDTDENAVNFFKCDDIFKFALYQNSTYTQKSVLPYYKKLGEKSSRKVNDIAIQIGIAIGGITGESDGLINMDKENPENMAKNAKICRQYIENLINHRENIRGWLRKLLECL